MIAGTSEAASLPVPQSDADSMYCGRRAAAERWLVRRCDSCGEPRFPPRHPCPSCRSSNLQWFETGGKRVIYASIEKDHVPVPALSAVTPYVVAPIEPADGPRNMANILGRDAREVRASDPIRVCFEQRGEHRLPQSIRSRDK